MEQTDWVEVDVVYLTGNCSNMSILDEPHLSQSQVAVLCPLKSYTTAVVHSDLFSIFEKYPLASFSTKTVQNCTKIQVIYC